MKDMSLTEFFTVHEFQIEHKTTPECEEAINEQLASCFDLDVTLSQL